MLHVEARHESDAQHWHHAPWRGEDHTARDAGLYMMTGHFRHGLAGVVGQSRLFGLRLRGPSADNG
jgi:hypothetical protein